VLKLFSAFIFIPSLQVLPQHSAYTQPAKNIIQKDIDVDDCGISPNWIICALDCHS